MVKRFVITNIKLIKSDATAITVAICGLAQVKSDGVSEIIARRYMVLFLVLSSP